MKELICITCPRGCRLLVDESLNVTGNFCPRGALYAKNELTHPLRTLTSTVRIKSKDIEMVPVKSKDPLPKELIFKAMDILSQIQIKPPVHIGDVIVKNILETGVDIVATRDILK